MKTGQRRGFLPRTTRNTRKKDREYLATKERKDVNHGIHEIHGKKAKPVPDGGMGQSAPAGRSLPRRPNFSPKPKAQSPEPKALLAG